MVRRPTSLGISSLFARHRGVLEVAGGAREKIASRRLHLRCRIVRRVATPVCPSRLCSSSPRLRRVTVAVSAAVAVGGGCPTLGWPTCSSRGLLLSPTSSGCVACHRIARPGTSPLTHSTAPLPLILATNCIGPYALCVCGTRFLPLPLPSPLPSPLHHPHPIPSRSVPFRFSPPPQGSFGAAATKAEVSLLDQIENPVLLRDFQLVRSWKWCRKWSTDDAQRSFFVSRLTTPCGLGPSVSEQSLLGACAADLWLAQGVRTAGLMFFIATAASRFSCLARRQDNHVSTSFSASAARALLAQSRLDDAPYRTTWSIPRARRKRSISSSNLRRSSAGAGVEEEEGGRLRGVSGDGGDGLRSTGGRCCARMSCMVPGVLLRRLGIGRANSSSRAHGRFRHID